MKGLLFFGKGYIEEACIIPCPSDCKLSEWSNWSRCSKSCGSGVKVRSKWLREKPYNGGRPCPKLDHVNQVRASHSVSCFLCLLCFIKVFFPIMWLFFPLFHDVPAVWCMDSNHRPRYVFNMIVLHYLLKCPNNVFAVQNGYTILFVCVRCTRSCPASVTAASTSGLQNPGVYGRSAVWTWRITVGKVFRRGRSGKTRQTPPHRSRLVGFLARTEVIQFHIGHRRGRFPKILLTHAKSGLFTFQSPTLVPVVWHGSN